MRSPLSSSQCVEQRPGVLQVSRIKSLGEPAIDRCEQIRGFLALALALPQPAQAYGRTQLPRLGLLTASNSQGLLEAGFRLRACLKSFRGLCNMGR